MQNALTFLLLSLGGLAFAAVLLSKALDFPKVHKALTIFLVSLGGLAFLGTLSMNKVLTNVFFSFGGFAVVWGIFIQAVPAMVAIYQRRKTRLTSQQLAIAMAAESDQQLLDMFPPMFDMSDDQQRELFPSALAMFPDGFQRSLAALDASRLELQKRNVLVPQVEFQPIRFMHLKESRDIKQVLSACLITALLFVPMCLHVIHRFDAVTVHRENYATFNFAAIFIQVLPPILAAISVLGVVVIPCVLLIQYFVFCDRRRKVAALAEAIAVSQSATDGD